MILEAQFGSDIAPIERPRIEKLITQYQSSKKENKNAEEQSTEAEDSGPPAENEKSETAESTETKEESADQQQEEPANPPEEDDEKLTEEDIAEIEAFELARLQSMGIPVPGIEIRVDSHVAKVWLDTLEVECASQIVKDRVRVIVDRAVETVAGLWSAGGGRHARNELHNEKMAGIEATA